MLKVCKIQIRPIHPLVPREQRGELVLSQLGLVCECRLEGVDRRNLEFTNLSTHYKLGLALELNPSLKERGKQINQRNIADDTVICFTEVRFQRT